MTSAKTSMQPLFKKLQNTGFDPKFIKSLLPDWWDDSIADTPSGFQQAALLLGRLLTIKPDSLWNQTSDVVFALPASKRFKHRVDLESDALDVACALAFSAGRIVHSGLDPLAGKIVIPDARMLRENLLKDTQWIGFAELLDYCFSIGIPVIYLDHLPLKAKKMDGLAFDCHGRPTIVLTKRQKNGYLLFDLAHELGHIALNHLQLNGCIIDQKIDANAEDGDERAANNFALELLTGDAACKIVPVGRNLTGSELASAAMCHARNKRIDPTHVAMNYGHSVGHWGVANIAVKQLIGDAQSDQKLMRDKLFNILNIIDMKEEDLAALARMVGRD